MRRAGRPIVETMRMRDPDEGDVRRCLAVSVSRFRISAPRMLREDRAAFFALLGAGLWYTV